MPAYQRGRAGNEQRFEMDRQIKGIDKQIESLVDRVVESDNAALVKAYEQKIAKLQKERLLAEENREKMAYRSTPTTRFSNSPWPSSQPLGTSGKAGRPTCASWSCVWPSLTGFPTSADRGFRTLKSVAIQTLGVGSRV